MDWLTNRSRARLDRDWLDDISARDATKPRAASYQGQSMHNARVCPVCKMTRSPRQFLANPMKKDSRKLKTCHQCRTKGK